MAWIDSSLPRIVCTVSSREGGICRWREGRGGGSAWSLFFLILISLERFCSTPLGPCQIEREWSHVTEPCALPKQKYSRNYQSTSQKSDTFRGANPLFLRSRLRALSFSLAWSSPWTETGSDLLTLHLFPIRTISLVPGWFIDSATLFADVISRAGNPGVRVSDFSL